MSFETAELYINTANGHVAWQPRTANNELV